MNVQAIVLAAGRSTRFKSPTSKLLTPVAGIPMILHVTKALTPITTDITLVVGHEAENIMHVVKQAHPSVQFVEQKELLGTGHALMQTKATWHADTVLVVNGDCPLIQTQTLKRLITAHVQHNHTVSFAVAYTADPDSSYGRVIEQEGRIAIVEKKDLTHDPALYPLVNAGLYIMQTAFLRNHIHELSTRNAAREYYITDLIALAQQHGGTVGTLLTELTEVAGVNTVEELIAAEHIQQKRILLEKEASFFNQERQL